MSTKIESTAVGIRVTGDMTVYAAGQIKQPLLEALAQCPATFELDLSCVSEFDTAGLQLLLLAWREGLANGRQLRLGATSNAVREALALFGAQGLLSVVPALGDRP